MKDYMKIYREWLSILIGQVNLLSHFKVFRSREFCNLYCEDSFRIRHSISFFRHQMDVHYLTNFHISYCCIKSFDHLSCTTYELKRLSTVIRRIKLSSVIECSFVMCTAFLSNILSFHCSV